MFFDFKHGWAQIAQSNNNNNNHQSWKTTISFCAEITIHNNNRKHRADSWNAESTRIESKRSDWYLVACAVYLFLYCILYDNQMKTDTIFTAHHDLANTTFIRNDASHAIVFPVGFCLTFVYQTLFSSGFSLFFYLTLSIRYEITKQAKNTKI